jgi:DNA-binding transcriptional MerR regulator
MAERLDDAVAVGPADGDHPVRGLAALDDADAAVYTIGQAAELLGVPVAGLRRLDDAAALTPHRSGGGQRRYSRRQLERARRLLDLVEQGTPIAAAGRIADLEGQVAGLEQEVADLRDERADAIPEPATAPDDGPPA